MKTAKTLLFLILPPLAAAPQSCEGPGLARQRQSSFALHEIADEVARVRLTLLDAQGQAVENEYITATLTSARQTLTAVRDFLKLSSEKTAGAFNESHKRAARAIALVTPLVTPLSRPPDSLSRTVIASHLKDLEQSLRVASSYSIPDPDSAGALWPLIVDPEGIPLNRHELSELQALFSGETANSGIDR